MGEAMKLTVVKPQFDLNDNELMKLRHMVLIHEGKGTIELYKDRRGHIYMKFHGVGYKRPTTFIVGWAEDTHELIYIPVV